MVKIHPTVILDPAAQLGENVEVDAFTIIKGDVIVGDGTKIGTGSYLDDGTRIGRNCQIGHRVFLGNPPQDLKYAGEKTYLEIGDGTVIREFCTLNRGTTYHYKTVVGKNCFIMTYVHIAHDCIIGDNVIIANAVNLAGHVEIHSHATIGGMTPIHQFVKVGQHAFVGGGLRVSKDVPPFIRAMGEPLRYGGTNFVGLQRKGFSREVILEIKRAYDLIYHSKYTVTEAVQVIAEKLQPFEEIKLICDFIKNSERGIIRG
ncbi:MAG: acyl-ACP--UDP-N-acetylglucosamine O-acyltransferase [Calditrichia bacterium]